MSTLTVADIPLDSNSPAQRLRRIAAAVRVSLHWWGTHRSLIQHTRRRILAGAGHRQLGRDVHARAERAFALLEDGLGTYAVRSAGESVAD